MASAICDVSSTWPEAIAALPLRYWLFAGALALAVLGLLVWAEMAVWRAVTAPPLDDSASPVIAVPWDGRVP
jgi:hypothetical protein